ncbi:MAG: hypothetical protein J6T15_04700 [Bacilli bacterium]|nr:hypothetical protein [Bacilli bacterium]
MGELEEMLNETTLTNDAQPMNAEVEVNVIKEESQEEQVLKNEIKVESEHKNLYLLKEAEDDAFRTLGIYLDNDFERELADDIELLEQVKERIETKKAEIKKFIEDNQLASFKTNLLNIKYVSATTTTSIDSARLKKEMPEIAAKYSKVGARSSSVSIDILEMPKLAEEIIDL